MKSENKTILKERNLKLTIEYNGAKFFGWQKQNEKRTVQGDLEQAFFQLTKQAVEVEGSGRTDRGVHAMGQVASVKIVSAIPTENFKVALNNLLAEDVRVKSVEEVDLDFHARFSAKKKTYKYVVDLNETASAINCDLVGHYPYQIDSKKIKQAKKLLVGKHNFKGFCSADTNVKNFEREIYKIDFSLKKNVAIFEVTGNGFLYNMVRILVGTMLDGGRGKITLDSIKKALETGERKYAGTTMPAGGLYLKCVEYNKQ